MKANIYEYMHPQAGQKFNTDLELFAIKYFGNHNVGARITEDGRYIWNNWLKLAREFSLDVSQGGERPTNPDPYRLSPIKLASLLAWAIWNARPVSDCLPIDDEVRQALGKCDIEPKETATSDLIRRYPHQMLAIGVAENIFHRFQAGRQGSITYGNPARPPYTDHYRKNLCICLGRGVLGPEALYLIFKTMDLFGYLPTAGERLNGAENSPSRDTRRLPA